MAFDPKQFTESILTGATVDPATRAQLEALIANPALMPKFVELQEGNLRQADYSKKMADTQAYWDRLHSWETANKEPLEAELARLKANGNVPQPHNDAPNGTPSNYQQELQRLAQEAVAYNNLVMQIGLKHYKEFGEVLDTNEVMKIAGKEQMNFANAYDKLIQPKREEIQKAEFTKQIEEARKQGAEEALKNLSMPVSNIPTSSTPSPLDGLNGAGRSTADGAEPKFGAMAAVRAFSSDLRKGTIPNF